MIFNMSATGKIRFWFFVCFSECTDGSVLKFMTLDLCLGFQFPYHLYLFHIPNAENKTRKSCFLEASEKHDFHPPLETHPKAAFTVEKGSIILNPDIGYRDNAFVYS